MTPVTLFAITGFLLLCAAWFAHPDTPFIDLFDSFWLFGLGILAGIAGWVMLFMMMTRHKPEWPLFWALAPSLAIVSVLTSWRLWDGQRWVPMLFGVLPAVAVAIWAARGGLKGAAGLALWMPAVAIVAGSAWYFSAWRDPRGQILIGDMINASGSAAAAAKIMAQPGQSEEEMERELFLMNAAQSLTAQHVIKVRFLCLLCLLALIHSALLFRLSPQFALLGIAGAIAAVVFPSITYWRARGDRQVRSFLLGSSAPVYDGLFVFALLFAVGQGAWAIFGG